MNFEDVIEGEFYKITTELSFVFYYADGQETLVRFEEGTVVQVLAKFSAKYGRRRGRASWVSCVCEVVSEAFDDEGNALIGAHLLEPLRGETGSDS